MNQDKSARYHALRRRATVVEGAWSVVLLLTLLLTGGSHVLRDVAAAFVVWAGVPATLSHTALVLAYLVMLGVLHEAGGLPIAFYRGFLLEHRYGLSTERLRHWLMDVAKSWLLGGLLSAAGFALLYAAIRRWPAGWWIAAGIGFTAVVVLMVRLAPVLLMPIFFRFKPLAREELRRRLLDLSKRARVPVVDVAEWQLSDRTKKGNAALAGLGRTRRIIVSDTLLSSCSDDEIEAVLAHELGHQAHHDLWLVILLESVIATAGFFAASRVMIAAAPPLGLAGPADVAGMPLFLLVVGALSLLLVPLVNACSRAMERRADRFALRLTGNPDAFAGAMQRLGQQNLAEEHPSRLAVWLFYSHPPMAERIDAARNWQR